MIRARSYSKINLWLRVVDRRTDGYHDIETVFHTVSLHDRLTIEGTSAALEITMEPHVEDNLVARAAAALRAHSASDRGARIDIVKSIPLEAGLAGGSGNAAAVLLALDRLWSLHLPRPRLLEIALELGSDVPFMLEGGTMLGAGRGERLAPLDPVRLWFVLGISNVGLATREVYGRWQPGSVGGSTLDDVRAALSGGGPGRISSVVRNDLEEPALYLRPQLADRKSRLIEAGAMGAFLSGSGPTIVGIARGEEHARGLSEAVRTVFDRVEVVRSYPHAVELEGGRPL